MSFCTTFYCGLISQFDSVALAEGVFGLDSFLSPKARPTHCWLLSGADKGDPVWRILRSLPRMVGGVVRSQKSPETEYGGGPDVDFWAPCSFRPAGTGN